MSMTASEARGVFPAKVRSTGKVYHFWRETNSAGLYCTICNPGLLRGKSELHKISGKERQCEVCKIHR
jgi:hypothetical protein